MTTFRNVLGLCMAALPLIGQVSPNINFLPSRAFGHTKLTFGPLPTTPNLLEGKEVGLTAAVAFDMTTSPPILYIADSDNHRVLAYRNPASLTKGNKADRAIGQRDLTSSFAGGPSANNGGLTSSGMTLPSGLAVDDAGNLYVADSGNNRILRFPRPMLQSGDVVTPDLVIGQKTLGSGRLSNQGLTKPTDRTLSLNRAGQVGGSALAIDSQGNLWVADTFNHRVLRFPRSRLNGPEPAADLVLGHQTFDNDDQSPFSYPNKNDLVGLRQPRAVAVDSKGAVYVSDNLLRVVYYATPSTGVNATRILGIDPPGTQLQPRPVPPSDFTLGEGKPFVQDGEQRVPGNSPQCIFLLNDQPFICDSIAHRVVRYGLPSSWPALTLTALSPPIEGVYGQNSLFDGEVNRAQGVSRAGANTMNLPSAGAFLGTEMWIGDAGNSRVLAFTQGGNLTYTAASRVVGQMEFDLNGKNLVEGRELFFNATGYQAAGVAVDRNNHLYVADTINNRVLGFRDVRTVGTDIRGNPAPRVADIVIGQPDLLHTGVNYPGNEPLLPTSQGLFSPSAVAVDAAGNVWVADTGNGRILRFPDPFRTPGLATATLVLGQPNLFTKLTDKGAALLSAPAGIAVFNNGDVAAADITDHRVLLFRKSGGEFTNGQPARTVLGQQNFTSVNPSATAAGLASPRGLAVDTSDRLYVADTANNRVIVYSTTATTPNGATGTAIPNINAPTGVAVSPNSGEIWISAVNAQAVFRFRDFSQLGSNPQATAQLSSAGPLAIALDNFDNIIAAELSNRLAFYYARVVYQNAATYASTSAKGVTLTPGMYVNMYRSGKPFEFTEATATIPYPKTLSGIQVLVNGIPAPIYLMTKDSIRMLVPNDAPSTGEVEYLVTRPATGEIVAAGTFLMGPAAPGFFTANQAGTGQIAATNTDGTPNSASNGAPQGSVMTIWMHGFGHLDNLSPDGEAPGRAIDTDVKPVITIGGLHIVPADRIHYSGLSPEFPGLWQINFTLPKTGDVGAPVPGTRIPILVQMRDIPSNIGFSPDGLDKFLNVSPHGDITTISIK